MCQHHCGTGHPRRRPPASSITRSMKDSVILAGRMGRNFLSPAPK